MSTSKLAVISESALWYLLYLTNRSSKLALHCILRHMDSLLLQGSGFGPIFDIILLSIDSLCFFIWNLRQNLCMPLWYISLWMIYTRLISDLAMPFIFPSEVTQSMQLFQSSLSLTTLQQLPGYTTLCSMM